MATVVHSARSLEHVERTVEFLRKTSPDLAIDALAAIRSGADALATHPLLGRRVQGELRELVISYGRTGFVALYRFDVRRDEARILALRHQRELGFVP